LARSRQSAGGRAQGGAALGTAVGAAHRLPSAARLGVVRRNSLRALCALRSDKAPQVRSTKRAARADPETALLGAAHSAAPPWARPPADCRSGTMGGVRHEGVGGARSSDEAAARADRHDVGTEAVACARHRGIGKGAGPGRPAPLLAPIEARKVTDAREVADLREP